jgi:hypothetical protein
MLDKQTFEKEIKICQKMYKEKGGCNWGKCEECGAVPLLHKLNTDEVVEDKEEVERLRKTILE